MNGNEIRVIFTVEIHDGPRMLQRNRQRIAQALRAAGDGVALGDSIAEINTTFARLDLRGIALRVEGEE